MIKINVARVYTPLRVFDKSSILVDKGIVVGIKPHWFSEGEVYDFKESIAVPGFVDTHIHGHGGFDVNKGSEQELVNLAKYLAKKGVTSFVPTTVSLKHEYLSKVASLVGELDVERITMEGGSRVLGAHLEGPYINIEMRGAQNPDAIRRADLGEIEEYLRLSRGRIRIITLAPEIEGALEAISYLVKKRVIVSIGHSNATYDIAKKAFEAGASRVTHVFNAMRRFHHRDPGIVGAAIEDESVYVEFIPDLIHLAEPVVKLVIKLFGERSVAITDAISATGLPDGEYDLGGLRIYVSKGVARLGDGTLAGSTLTMINALRNLHLIGLSLEKALAHVTLYPARSLNLSDIGCLRPGCRADIVLLSNDLEIEKVFIEGNEVDE